MNWLLGAARQMLPVARMRIRHRALIRRATISAGSVLVGLLISVQLAAAQSSVTPDSLPGQDASVETPRNELPPDQLAREQMPDAGSAAGRQNLPAAIAVLHAHLTAVMPLPLSRLLNAGGAVAWLLFVISVLMLSVILFKLVQFIVGGLVSPFARRRVNALVGDFEAGRIDAAGLTASSGRDALGRLIGAATHVLDDGALDDAARNAEVSRLAAVSISRLRSQLGTLEVIASVAPMLGLLGTVLGMIEAFRAMEAAGDAVDPAVLSAGIWKALLTTAIGLVVAVPAILAHSAFERRIEGFAQAVGDLYGRVATADARHTAPARSAGLKPDEHSRDRPVAVLAGRG